MRTFCITLPEKPERKNQAQQHFTERGVNAEFFTGINGQKMGITNTPDHPYMRDRKPGDPPFYVGTHCVGIFLSHYMLWNALTLLPDQHFFILEDDAKFEDGWKAKMEKAMMDVPQDFDWLFIGSCCAKNQRHKRHVSGNIWDVRYPQCFHAYVVAKKALPHLIATNRDCYAPIDISVTLHSFSQLKVYTLLPRIVEQFNTEIQP
jgi:GR25 family glycosyltransferase involved in LPS biosynthesis